ncbi:hypothetical protein [Maridesulfovibrio sp. FT414]|uniref:hypothetical protein n=1 Tax=Maridesulfovibrio sp. FT414 TaxID=2979469 RepID=UPI003D808BC4
MSNDLAVKNLAAEYAGHFDFDFGPEGVKLTLLDDAPDELRQMIKDVCGQISPETLVQVYEALNAISEAEDIYQCEIDEKVCGLTLFCKIARHIEKIAVS